MGNRNQNPGLSKPGRRALLKGATMIFDNKSEVKNDPDGPERRTVTMA